MALATLLVFLFLKRTVQGLTSRPLDVLVSSQNTFLVGLNMAGSFLSFKSLVPWFLLEAAIPNQCRQGITQALSITLSLCITFRALGTF